MQSSRTVIDTSFPMYDPYRISGDFAKQYNIEPTVASALRVLHEIPETFNTTFFSRKNIDFIQSKLISETKKYTGFVIGPQDEGTLVEIMTGVYVQDSTYDPNDLAGSLAKINKIVITEGLKQILPGVRAYSLYVRDASRPYGGGGESAFARPILASTKGSRTLPGVLFLDRNA
ncbi:hypothetical protein PBCVNEJV1_873L [Paramecium bursaria Chlorella virus NE-JV-1]|nr:hypothetical protein PBCVNEJV1_873L [Paramecium bursaria Chlorella virus NE-JV-1]